MKRTVLLLFALFLALHPGCKQQAQPSTTEARSPLKQSDPLPEDALVVPVTGKHGGRLVTASFQDPKTFNQIVFLDTDSQTYNQLMSPGLTRLNLQTQEPEPALAKSWDVSPDHLTWTFHLRKGVRWSDGTPFTAADVIFTMQIVNDPAISSSAQDALLLNDEPIVWTQSDDHTVTAQLPDVYVSFLRQLDGATIPIVAKHKWEAAYMEGKFAESMQVSMDPKDFVSLGPFTLSSYTPGEKLALKRNPHYWKIDQNRKRLPYLDEIVFLILPDQNQVQMKIENGEIDTYYSIRPEDIERLKQKSASLKMSVINVGPAYDREGLFLNQNGGKNSRTGKPYVHPTKRAWFTDVNFRKAISHGINREALVQNALYGMGVPAYGPESVSNERWYNERISTYPYDPPKAIEILKQSGFRMKEDRNGKPTLYDKKGNPVRFSLHTNQGNTLRNAQCTLIADDLAKLGMQVDYTPLDFNSLVTRIQNSFDFDAILIGISHDDTDPTSGLNTWKSDSGLHFWWPLQKSPATVWETRIDELVERQLRTFDYHQRKTYYDELQQIVSEQQPMIYTVTQYIFVCAREGLGNLKPTVSRHRTLWNADELYWN